MENQCKSCGGELIYKDYFSEENPENGELTTGNIYQCLDCKEEVLIADNEILAVA